MKKMMATLTGVLALATMGVVAPAMTSLPAVNAATKSPSPSLTVATVTNGAKSITGTATKGSKITVKASKNAKSNLATATASTKTGKFTAKLSKAVKTGASVYVYATNPKTGAYFYRIMNVQAGSSTAKTTAAKATSTKSSATKKTASFSVKTPTGTWKSDKHNGYQQVWTFSQATGLNEAVYKNGKLVKTTVAYAKYDVYPQSSTTFWKVTYKAKGAKTSQNIYLNFTSAKTFQLVNSKNKATKISANPAPAAAWTFTKTK